MKKKKSKNIRTLERIKLDAQIRLLNKQIAQIGKPESWWKRNVVPLAAVGVSLIAAISPQARTTQVNVPRPAIEQQRDSNREDDKEIPLDPLAPPFPESIVCSDPTAVGKYFDRHEPSSRYTISKVTFVDPATSPLLAQVYKILEKSEDPQAMKAKIIETLEQQPTIHPKLVGKQFVKRVVSEVENVKIVKS